MPHNELLLEGPPRRARRGTLGDGLGRCRQGRGLRVPEPLWGDRDQPPASFKAVQRPAGAGGCSGGWGASAALQILILGHAGPPVAGLSLAAWISQRKKDCRAAAADTRSKPSSAFMSEVGPGKNVGARMTQKPLVTIAVSKVTRGECRHMGCPPAGHDRDRWTNSMPGTHRPL